MICCGTLWGFLNVHNLLNSQQCEAKECGGWGNGSVMADTHRPWGRGRETSASEMVLAPPQGLIPPDHFGSYLSNINCKEEFFYEKSVRMFAFSGDNGFIHM